MKLLLKNANETRDKKIELDLGDKVKITEWDGIVAEGIVDEVTKTSIKLIHGRFRGGAYSQGDYSEYESATEFSFELDDLFSIEKADYTNTMNPLTMIHKVKRENYCGSEKLVMSPLFHDWYMSFMKDKRAAKNYEGLPITVDSDLPGLAVNAVPNEATKKHNITPLNCYTISYYKKGKYAGFSVFSCYENKLEKELKRQFKDFQNKTGTSTFAYKLTKSGKLIERGSLNQRIILAS